MKVVYILLHFPKLTETFVAEEIHALLSRDIDVRIVSLLNAGSGPAQPLSRELLNRVRYAPGLLSVRLWRAHLFYLVRSPRLSFGLLAGIISQPSPKAPVTSFFKRLAIYLKAVSVAYELRDSDVSLLHAHFAWLSGAAAWIMARLLKKPFTVTVHAYDIYSPQNDYLRLVTREASHVVAISEYNRRHIEALRTAAPRDISVIHCGVDVKKLDAESMRQQERPGRGPLKILTVGSLVPKKGHRVLVAACQRLEKSGLDFRCTIIGSGPEGPALSRQIDGAGLRPRIEMRGARSLPEIADAYRRHDLFVLACQVAPDGDRDGIPVVLMEAGMMGLPLISTTVSGIPELVLHAQTGWLVPPGDDAALAEAIALLAADPGLRTRLGESARAFVRSRFGIEQSAERLASLFREVSGRPMSDDTKI